MFRVKLEYIVNTRVADESSGMKQAVQLMNTNFKRFVFN